MISAEKPERSELAEISTAALEGVDSFILTHETSCGKSPIESTTFLAKAIAEAEGIYDYEQAFANVKDEVKTKSRASAIDLLVSTGLSVAFDEGKNLDMFVCLTETGKTARYIAKFRPKQPILACSTNGQTVRQVNMNRGVVGYKIPEHMANKTDELIDLILQVAQEQYITDLPTSKVMIFTGINEGNPKKEDVTFKLIGGEEKLDDEEEGEEEVEENEDIE